jgi:hypothetical protein
MSSSAKPCLGVIHASPASREPVLAFYGQTEFSVVDRLDAEAMKDLAAGNQTGATARLSAHARDLVRVHGARAILLTCSALELAGCRAIEQTAGVPTFRIDGDLAREAIRHGQHPGLVVTFPAALNTFRGQLALAAAPNPPPHLQETLLPGAYEDLLAGKVQAHDAAVARAATALALAGCDVVVMAQVSMARAAELARADLAQRGSDTPVLTALDSSLKTVRKILG